ncbi:MAG: lysyl oxidase family protein [Polyangiales bacterium]
MAQAAARSCALLVVLAACAPRPVADLWLDASLKPDGAPADVAGDLATDTAPGLDAAGDVFVDVPVVIDPDGAPPPMDAAADRPGDVPGDRADVFTPPTDGGPLPNLIPVISNPQIQERTFSAGSCEVMEGCTVAGDRRLLRFDLTTPNVGAADLYLGAPTAAGRPLAMFEYGTCHGHYHLRGYADYRLITPDGREVGRGHKQSFCLLDSGRYMGMGTDIPADMRYNCGNQGIHAGWMDIYGRGLDCQYVDITTVPPGRYRIRAQINVDRVVAESNYADNESFYDIDIPPPPTADGGVPDGGLSTDPTLACPGATEGLNRNCGWMVEGSPRTCTPGARVVIGCNQGCSPAIGVCAGDPMLRVCPGNIPCTDLTAIASNDDSCPPADGGPTRLCSRVEFTCPSIGRYTILSGSFRAGGAYECHFDIL